jgi:hypothetical protein
MKAWIERRPGRLEYSVALGESRANETIAATGLDEGGRIVWTEIGRAGAEIPFFLHVDPETLEAIVRASSDAVPASDATTSHLKDAIGVRDRLLAMVESVTKSVQSPEEPKA